MSCFALISCSLPPKPRQIDVSSLKHATQGWLGIRTSVRLPFRTGCCPGTAPGEKFWRRYPELQSVVDAGHPLMTERDKLSPLLKLSFG